MNRFNFLKEYNKALIENINLKNIPKNLNLIFDGGAFNGGFAGGIMMYLKSMEEQKLIKIHCVSGCSIGSLLGVWYLSDCILEGFNCFEQFMDYFKKNTNLRAYKTIVTTYINIVFKKKAPDFINQLNGRLFITYYNVKTHKQKTVSKFRNKEHLIDCIIRSSHVPFVINGKASYKKKYMDGISPYLIKNDVPSLFIKLMTINKCSRAFMIKSENNIHYRVLAGIADANDFFTTGKSDMCSYIHEWSSLNFFQLRIRELVFFYIFSLIEWITVLKTYVPDVITNSMLYNVTINTLHNLYRDLCGQILV